MADGGSAGVRIDRWLWAARAFRSRSLASEACAGGRVKVNGLSAKAHKLVRAGDLVEIGTRAGPRELRVVALSERRGPASEARALYEDLTPPPPPTVDEGSPGRVRGRGRPTKRERRLLDHLRSR